MNDKDARIQIDYTIVDQYGNMSHICKDQELFEEFDGDGLEAYCEAFRLLLIQVGYCFLENKKIEFIDKE